MTILILPTRAIKSSQGSSYHIPKVSDSTKTVTYCGVVIYEGGNSIQEIDNLFGRELCPRCLGPLKTMD